jgi:hypothetical protein
LRALVGDSTITSRRPPPPLFFVRVDPATLSCSFVSLAHISCWSSSADST